MRWVKVSEGCFACPLPGTHEGAATMLYSKDQGLMVSVGASGRESICAPLGNAEGFLSLISKLPEE